VEQIGNETEGPLIKTGETELSAMKTILGCMALTLALAVTTITADAKGCIKGAVVGGVAGHYAGHHGLLGAAAGCAVGHHEAKKNARESQNSR
jgi:hypothetical protein